MKAAALDLIVPRLAGLGLNDERLSNVAQNTNLLTRVRVTDQRKFCHNRGSPKRYVSTHFDIFQYRKNRRPTCHHA